MTTRPRAKSPAKPRRPRLVATAAPLAPAVTAKEVRLPAALLALIAAAFMFLLVTAAVALVPARALPARVSAAVDGRRELLVFIALCALGFAFGIVLLMALASS